MEKRKPNKPFDIVKAPTGEVGMITEVSVNDCQEGFDDMVSYSVDWFEGDLHTAWWDHKDLTVLCNLFVKIAENSCHPMGYNEEHVEALLSESLIIEEKA